MPEVDLVLGNAEKLTRAPMPISVSAAAKRVRVNDIMSVRETAAQFVDSFEGRARAFLQVQNGCDHRCTFCIIPLRPRQFPQRADGRGGGRGAPAGRKWAFREIVLTGVDLTAYGADLPGHPSLGQLVRSILKHVPELARLRLSSIDSIEADASSVRAIAEEERLMPHFHLSAAVRRRHDPQAHEAPALPRRHDRFLRPVRGLRPDAAFGADLIAGFPTETDAMFDNTLALVDEAGLEHACMCFPSARGAAPRRRACHNCRGEW